MQGAQCERHFAIGTLQEALQEKEAQMREAQLQGAQCKRHDAVCGAVGCGALLGYADAGSVGLLSGRCVCWS